jgi:putative solute:sodium symporter small subunit
MDRKARFTVLISAKQSTSVGAVASTRKLRHALEIPASALLRREHQRSQCTRRFYIRPQWHAAPLVAPREMSLYSAHFDRTAFAVAAPVKSSNILPARDPPGLVHRSAIVLVEEASMPLTAKHREYWRMNLAITGVLLLIWFVATFVVGYFARELNALSFYGWPLGFYMAAQGSLIVYVVIIWYYARHMNDLDQRYGVAEEDEE